LRGTSTPTFRGARRGGAATVVRSYRDRDAHPAAYGMLVLLIALLTVRIDPAETVLAVTVAVNSETEPDDDLRERIEAALGESRTTR
jgi:hypothetical protein